MNPYYDHAPTDLRKDFLNTNAPKVLFAINAVLAVVYFAVLVFFFPIGNKILFAGLIAGEIFHLWQVLTFLYTVWDTTYQAKTDPGYQPPVDVFITVAGEPVELVQKTVTAARAMRYPHFKIYILNDGYVAQKDNWRDIEALASRMGVHCITRTVPGGAKAGNINNALKLSNNPLVAIFDADHVPHPDFLLKTAAYFTDARVAFVQTPQFYKNYSENFITRSSWEQQELFFGPICKGKNRLNAATMCGTNMLISREALTSVGGMCTESIAEDFITGLMIHARGWRSVYHGEVLAEGLATEDLLSYSKQQFRWARGALDVIFRWNPLFMPGLSWAQKLQYLASASFYLSGLFVVLDALLPVIYFYTGMVPVIISGMLLATVFLPYLFFTFYTIQRSSNFTFTFQSLGFSMGSFNIHMQALYSAATFQRSAFGITQKRKQDGNFLPLVKWHIAYCALVAGGIVVAYIREGFSASFFNNIAWGVLNIVIFAPFIRAALPDRTTSVPPVLRSVETQKTYVLGKN
jgi:cellulose synthase (UDP-forming)